MLNKPWSQALISRGVALERGRLTSHFQLQICPRKTLNFWRQVQRVPRCYVSSQCLATKVVRRWKWFERQKKVLGCLGDLLGMKCYPLMWGIIHEPWNKDTYQTTSIIECTAGFFSRLTWLFQCGHSPSAPTWGNNYTVTLPGKTHTKPGEVQQNERELSISQNQHIEHSFASRPIEIPPITCRLTSKTTWWAMGSLTNKGPFTRVFFGGGRLNCFVIFSRFV